VLDVTKGEMSMWNFGLAATWMRTVILGASISLVSFASTSAAAEGDNVSQSRLQQFLEAWCELLTPQLTIERSLYRDVIGPMKARRFLPEDCTDFINPEPPKAVLVNVTYSQGRHSPFADNLEDFELDEAQLLGPDKFLWLTRSEHAGNTTQADIVTILTVQQAGTNRSVMLAIREHYRLTAEDHGQNAAKWQRLSCRIVSRNP
jgi:hypothetical protein